MKSTSSVFRCLRRVKMCWACLKHPATQQTESQACNYYTLETGPYTPGSGVKFWMTLAVSIFTLTRPKHKKSSFNVFRTTICIEPINKGLGLDDFSWRLFNQ